MSNDVLKYIKGYNPQFSKPNMHGRRAEVMIVDECSDFSPGGKFAPVAPFHIYRNFQIHGYTPKTVLLLAHDVVAHKKEYAEVFNENAWDNTTIIMDNSVVELKQAVDAEMVFDAAETVAADIVVLPDVLNSGEQTIKATMDVLEEWRWKFREYELMSLIQGSHTEEWLHCLEVTLAEINPDWIGIPRCAEDNTLINMHRIELVNIVNMCTKKPIHLFGFSESPHQDLLAAKHPQVQSIDSASPLRLDDADYIFTNPGPRGDWWDKCTFNPVMIEICHAINSYIGA